MDFVNGNVVGIPVFERVWVIDVVYDTDGVMDFVKGNVVGIPDFERVWVIDVV